LHRYALNFAIAVLLPAFGMSGAEPSEPAAPQQKKPWEWTVEERLAVRLDPAKIAERQDAAEAGQHMARPQSAPVRREDVHNYSIDGSRYPELLLPHELFQSLLTGFVPEDHRRMRQRESLRRGIVAAGFDEELFWTKLRSAAGDYIDNYVYPPPGSIESESRGHKTLCRAAFLALNSARQALGREEFDRLLYEVVAPLTQVASATSAADPAAELRQVAGGCGQ